MRFVTDAEGLHWAVGRVEASGNCTVRVIPIPAGSLGTSAQAVHEKLAACGPGGEVFSQDFPLLALTVPAHADLPRIKAVLAQECRRSRNSPGVGSRIGTCRGLCGLGLLGGWSVNVSRVVVGVGILRR